jgi:hypothetical protein
MTLGIQPILKMVYKPTTNNKSLRWITRHLPYKVYLTWLAQYDFRHTHTVIFDHLVAPVAFYLSKAGLEGWFEDAGLEIIDMSARN